MGWKLNEWTGLSKNSAPMSSQEIKEATKYLRQNHCPKPDDCLDVECPGYRPACKLDVCHVATRLCGDF